MPQTAIKRVSLPLDPRNFRGDPFEIAHQTSKICVTWNANQHVQMVRHQEQDFHVPFLSVVITPSGLEYHPCDSLSTELIGYAGFAANCDEEGSAKASVMMS